MSTSAELHQSQDKRVQALVLSWVRTLVPENEEVVITLAHDAAFSTIHVKASEEAISILVGEKGQMARALRTLLAGASTNLGRRYALDLQPRQNT